MNRNKHGYKTTEQHTYEIELNNNTYSVQVDVELFVKPPDYDTWDSDYDFYGYTEVLNVNITNIFAEDENGNETEIQYNSLNVDVKQEIERQLDQLIIKG